VTKSPDTIDDYIVQLPDLAREFISAIRGRISAAAPEAVEGIKYGMPTATLHGTNIVYYAAWKKHIGLYPIYPGNPAFEAVVSPFRDNKDTVRFPLDTPVPFEVIDLILTTRIRSLRERRESL
jgi:uncharacterized protein YdhG (YjbR/CyaY superfamily)